jgi:hypothetical protein
MTTIARDGLIAPTTAFMRLSNTTAIAVLKPIVPVITSRKPANIAGLEVTGGGMPILKLGILIATGVTKTTKTTAATTTGMNTLDKLEDS